MATIVGSVPKSGHSEIDHRVQDVLASLGHLAPRAGLVYRRDRGKSDHRTAGQHRIPDRRPARRNCGAYMTKNKNLALIVALSAIAFGLAVVFRVFG